MKQQKRDGDLRGKETMYSHGVATSALAEACGMTSDSRRGSLAETPLSQREFPYRRAEGPLPTPVRSETAVTRCHSEN